MVGGGPWTRAAAPLLAICSLGLGSAWGLPSGLPVASPGQIIAVPRENNLELTYEGNEAGLRSALDTLRAGGGIIIVGPGEYRISQPLTVWDRTALVGYGERTSLIATAPPTSSMQLLRVGDSCRIALLTLVGTGYVPSDFKAYNSRGIVGGTSGKGGMDYSVIEGCRLSGWNTTAIDLLPNSSHNIIRNNSISRSGWEGIYLAQYCDSNIVEGNRIYQCRRNAIDVVGSYNVIRGNAIEDIGLDSLSLAWDTDGILLYSRAATTGSVRGNQILGNSVVNAFNGITVHAGAGSEQVECLVQDNTVIDCRRFGIRIAGLPYKPDPRVNHMSVTSNIVARCDSSGVILERVPQDVSLTANRIYLNRGDGIEITSIQNGVRGVSVRGNEIRANRGHAIGLHPLARDVHVGDNIISGNGSD